jgi:hypothetical protein
MISLKKQKGALNVETFHSTDAIGFSSQLPKLEWQILIKAEK